MKLQLAAAILCSATCAAAEPPASLANLVYYETGRTTARSAYWLGIALEPNGTAGGLFYATTGAGAGGSGLPVTGSPTSGRWTYSKKTDETAELLITAGGGMPNAGNRTLSFLTSDSGTARFDETFAVFAMTFHMAPLSSRAPLVNCSNRSLVPPGGSAFTGFVITGDRPRAVLVRGVGPALRLFGLSDGLADPKIVVARGTQVVGQNDDWEPLGGESIRATGAFVGAFPLGQASKDAALVVMLPAGEYVAQVSGADAADTGQALIEVYLLP